jgi:hypothetical protein
MAVGLSGLAVLAGCSSGPVMVGPRPPASYRAEQRAEGEACGFLIFGVIPSGSFQRRTEIAYQRALKGGGQALTDTSIRHSWYVIPFVGYLLCTHLEGKVVG